MKKYSKLIWILRCVLAVIPFLMMDRALRVATNRGGWINCRPACFHWGSVRCLYVWRCCRAAGAGWSTA